MEYFEVPCLDHMGTDLPNMGCCQRAGGTCEIEIKPQHSIAGIDGYIVFGRLTNSHVMDKDEAIQIPLDEARAAAQNEAMRRGAVGHVALTTNVAVNAAEAGNKMEVLLGIKGQDFPVGNEYGRWDLEVNAHGTPG